MSDAQLEYILSAKAVREKARRILELSLKGEGEYTVHLDKLDSVADFVIGVIKEKYPSLKIPYHTRFNHFHVGGIDRVKKLNEIIKSQSEVEHARIMIDLVVTSVLLDAGAGNDWKFHDTDDHMYSRSEGLAVASYNMFMKGAFSSDVNVPLRADGPGLVHITEEHIHNGFQVSVGNPLLGVKGRAELLHKLGKACEQNKEIFGGEKVSRPGNLVDYLLRKCPNKKIEAEFLLKTVLQGFGSIWPGRIVFNDVNLGDTWRHAKVGEGAEGFVPFHKLSQWMTYSLLNPLEDLGFKILNLNRLTGLAEYRNGGLLLDSGLIVAKNNLTERPHHPDSKVVIEWRALTVALLDELAKVIQRKLKLSEDEFPLAKVLEGGTWWAGRKLANEMRGGKPPFEIISDGTVF
jgi:Protein of unknown function (DUF1688)